jgi:hypothetical protein
LQVLVADPDWEPEVEYSQLDSDGPLVPVQLDVVMPAPATVSDAPDPDLDLESATMQSLFEHAGSGALFESVLGVEEMVEEGTGRENDEYA